MNGAPQPTAIVRARQGRWLAGVCQGLGEARSVSPAWLRLGVIALTLCGGLGAILYLAAWLILPAAASDGEPGSRAVVVLVKAMAAICGLLVLAAVGAVATVFGYGWIVFGLAAATLLGVLSVPRLGPAWALLPVAALTVPAAALAADGVQLTPTDGAAVVQVPLSSLNTAHGRTYRSGLGTLLLDLRHTPLPRDRRLLLRIHAGVRRTIVALPSDQCVRVVVHRHIDPFPVRAATLLTGRTDHAFADLFLFGRLESGWAEPRSIYPAFRHRPAPTLTVDFASEGGSLYVRNYPDSINPDFNPDWPGVPWSVEPRPSTRGLSKRGATRLISAWRVRRRHALALDRRYRSLVGGPCAPRPQPARHARPAHHGRHARPAHHGRQTRPAHHGRHARPAHHGRQTRPAHKGRHAVHRHRRR